MRIPVLFFGHYSAIILNSELADYQVFGKILWCFVKNIDFSCAKIHDFFFARNQSVFKKWPRNKPDIV